MHSTQLLIRALKIAHVGPIDLQVEGAELVCLSGASGAGKSLLLRAIADILVHEGDMRLNGVSATGMPAPQWRQQVGMLPAESRWWYDSIAGHVAAKDISLLEELGFSEETLNWQVARCSTGEKQRLALYRLLVNQPVCLLLDEPTASLDPENTQRVEKAVNHYRTQHQAPVIWVSHNPEQIKRLADRHYVIKDGQLELQS